MWTELAYTTLAGVVVLPMIVKWKWPWLWKDFGLILKLGKLLKQADNQVAAGITSIDLFEQHVRKTPDKLFLLFEDQQYTFHDVDTLATKAANIAQNVIGLKKGDTVAMIMMNEPAFVWLYIGLLKIGVKVALINYKLRSKSLVHCLKVSGANVFIVGRGEELLHAVEEVKCDLEGVQFWMTGHDRIPPEFKSLDVAMENASTDPISKSVREGVKMSDVACYIYTSGTTGLPKAARVTHNRTVRGGYIAAICGLQSDDIVYCPLPLYHSSGLLVGFHGAILRGYAFALRLRFSASHFWEDCVKFKATGTQYIGETCRYLLAQPQGPFDKKHQIKCAIGNGLRADIWQEFKDRFEISNIYEFYAATEGNAAFINLDNLVGSCGRCTPFQQLDNGARFIKYDVDTEAPIKNGQGFCTDVAIGEPGLLIAKITPKFSVDGYHGKKELTEKKILRDVFKKGDVYFNSGDLLYRDKDYNVFFSDRLGDTFRWKGENVSTTEVSNTLTDINEIKDANVYGVDIPGHDGRAGMAVITLHEGQQVTENILKQLYHHSEEYLPNYARPLFLRFQKEMILTGTFKQIKGHLKKEGCNPRNINDELYFMDVKNKTYIPLDVNLYEQIVAGQVRI